MTARRDQGWLRRGQPALAIGYRNLEPVRPGGQSGPGPGGFNRGLAGYQSRRGRLGGLLRRAVAKRSPLRSLDWILLLTVLVISLIGTVLVYAATEPSLRQAGENPHTYLIKQLLNIAIGLVLMLGVSLLDYRQLRLYAPFVLVLSCLGLLAVLSPLGTIVNGARSWISLPGGFQIEPSEYAKIAVILLAAALLSDLRQGETRPGLRAVLLTLAVAAVPLALIVAEPDLGVTVLMVALIAGMITLSGVRWTWLAGLAGITVLLGFAVVKLHLLKSYQISRFTSFLHPSENPRGTGYSAHQSAISIGSGGMHGQGLFHGQLVAGGFVPEQHTDFIFSVAGEELGFVGCMVIIGLLALVLLRAIRIAAKADDQFGMLVAAGIAIWFAVQSFINIGMTMGIMPVTGLPLPFLSYGGSAMFADMIAIGALQVVHRHRTVFS